MNPNLTIMMAAQKERELELQRIAGRRRASLRGPRASIRQRLAASRRPRRYTQAPALALVQAGHDYR